MKIYLVTSGSYSYYGVESVWTTREKAEAEVARLKASDEWCDDPGVEEFWLDRGAEIDGVPLWYVTFRNEETTCVRAGMHGRVEAEGIFIGKHMYQRHGNAHFLVRADDEEHAIKVAAERRASLLAVHSARSEQPGEWIALSDQRGMLGRL